MSIEDYIWGEDEGYRYRTFNKFNFSFEFVQTWRDFMSLIMFILLVITYYLFGTFNLLFLTNWGLHFTFISISLNYQASNDQKQNPDKVSGFMFIKWRLAVIMYEIAICTEIVLSILFWLLLWKPPKEYTFKTYFAIWTHSSPLAFLLIDFWMQRWIFRLNRAWIVFVVGIVYAIVNFSYVKLYGIPIYPILPWNNTASIVLISVALGMILLSYAILTLLTYFNQPNRNRSFNQVQYVLIIRNSEIEHQMTMQGSLPKISV